MTSRKCPDSDDSAAQRFSVSAWVVLPIRAAKNGSSGRVSTTTSALIQSTHTSVTSASTGTTTPATSAGRKRAAYGSTLAAPWAASVTARSGAGRRSAGEASQWASSPSRSWALTSTPAQAATRSETQASPARSTNRPASHSAGSRNGIPSTRATTSAVSATANPMVARPWRTPTTARTATGRRAAGAAWSSRGSKGLMGMP